MRLFKQGDIVKIKETVDLPSYVEERIETYGREHVVDENQERERDPILLSDNLFTFNFYPEHLELVKAASWRDRYEI